MKYREIVISLVAVLIGTLASSSVLVASGQSAEELFLAIDNASVTMKKSEHLDFLLSLVASDSEYEQGVKDIAALELKEKFIPEGRIYAWKKSNFLSASDMIEFINTRDDDEIQSWLKPREISVIEKNTKNFTLVIFKSDLVDETSIGIKNLKLADLFGLIHEKTESKGIAVSSIERVEIVRPIGFDNWICVGFYIDKDGERRMTALINETSAFFDRPKELKGW